MRVKETGPWVVYQMTVHGKHSGTNAVCEQAEWNAMEAERPGYHTLVRGGMRSENEAELMARGTSGDALKRAPARKG